MYLHATLHLERSEGLSCSQDGELHCAMLVPLTEHPVPAQAAAASFGCPELDAVVQVAGQAAAVLAEALAPAALRELQELRSLLQVGFQMCRSSCSALLSILCALFCMAKHTSGFSAHVGRELSMLSAL